MAGPDNLDCYSNGLTSFPSLYCQPNLTSSMSEQNVVSNFVCLVNTCSPYIVNNNHEKPSQHSVVSYEADEEYDREGHIEIERSKALHDIKILNSSQRLHKVVTNEKSIQPNDSRKMSKDSDSSYLDLQEDQFIPVDNPNILKLTKMKWLSEGNDGSPDASPSLSPSISSSSSLASIDSAHGNSFNDKCLSTIMKLDKEQNMFGLSRLAMISARSSRRSKRDERPAFPQTAIVQICCKMKCRHKSNTDLPASIKCGGCRSCLYCPTPVCLPGPCCRSPPPDLPCPPTKCLIDYAAYYGMQLRLNKKPKFEPSPIELTPRSSCILAKPQSSRPCPHCPPCQPPSSCCPYIMPCYWPSRSGAPCTVPTRCFHNPPCRPARKPNTTTGHERPRCPTGKKCREEEDDDSCPNKKCPGNDPRLSDIADKYDK